MVIRTKGTGKQCSSGNGVRGLKGTSNWCAYFGDGVMGRVIGANGTNSGCGSSWDGVIGMKDTSKGCGSSGDAVIGMKGTSKGCGFCGDSGYCQMVWFFC